MTWGDPRRTAVRRGCPLPGPAVPLLRLRLGLCYSRRVRIERPAEFSLTVERSRFYALLTPLASPDGIDALLKVRRRDYRKANHHCWACRTSDPVSGTTVELSKDDGEVGHPGRVLLELLKKHDLEGALIVSRIFGGVKLGVGGVSRAFRDAGQGAINRLLEAVPARTSSPRPR
jgi:putative IMPACT (imprinted ancient) family translation regulator